MEIVPAKKNVGIVSEFYETMMKSYAKHTLTYSELEGEINSENIHLFPIFQNNRMIATGSLLVEKLDFESAPYYGSVHRITVDPEFRGLGFGTAVNKNALEYAAQIGCKQIYCSVLINTEGIGGGNDPNLSELNICTNKLSYKPTGYRLVDLPDFSRVDDLQFTSTAVLWRQIDGEDKSQVYEVGMQTLVNYYDNSNNFDVLDVLESNLHIYPPKKTGATLASSTNIDDFIGTEYLPSYFLPYYSENLKTVYFGFRYDRILTRTSSGSNVADINYALLSNQLNNNLLINLLEKIQERIIQRTEIIYGDPKIKENNI